MWQESALVRKVLFTAVAGLCLGYVILLVLKSPPAALHRTASAGLTWQECWFPTPTFTAVYCGYLHPDDDTQIAVVLIRRSLFARDLQPLLYVTGGPGAATIPHGGNIESWVQWLQNLDLDRDLVLFDFLSTGHSYPAYICPKFAQVGPQVLATSLSADGEAEIYDRIALDCYHDLTAKKVDLSKLTLPYTIKYVSQLLKVLPEVGWDIYGASYGTRVVLEVMRQPPPNIRAVVLDGVLPPDVDTYHMQPRLLHDALHNLFNSCNHNGACKQRFPDLESEFYAIVKKLDSQPLQYRVSDAETGKPVPVMINGQRLLTLVYLSMYRWDFIQQLPFALWAAKDGDKEPLRPMVEHLSYYYMEKAFTFNDVVFISAGCAERRYGITKEAMRKEASVYPQLQEYLSPTWKYDVCEYWTVPGIGDSYFQPIQSHLPTLLLAGELDPVTPSIWARHVHATLGNSFLLVVPGIGHDVIDSDRCAMVATQTFLRKRRNYTGVRCGENLRGPKFVTAFK
jgi:pimeloyl-ACP methyl ester carboxylesterase